MEWRVESEPGEARLLGTAPAEAEGGREGAGGGAPAAEDKAVYQQHVLRAAADVAETTTTASGPGGVASGANARRGPTLMPRTVQPASGHGGPPARASGGRRAPLRVLGSMGAEARRRDPCGGARRRRAAGRADRHRQRRSGPLPLAALLPERRPHLRLERSLVYLLRRRAPADRHEDVVWDGSTYWCDGTRTSPRPPLSRRRQRRGCGVERWRCRRCKTRRRAVACPRERRRSRRCAG